MKIRTGFISNSSSSSFICEVTGHMESGYDVSLDEVGFCECVNYHTLDIECLLNKEEFIEWCGDRENSDSSVYGIPAKHCPICTLSHIKPEEFIRYLVKENLIDVHKIENEIRDKFKSHTEFFDYIKSVCIINKSL